MTNLIHTYTAEFPDVTFQTTSGKQAVEWSRQGAHVTAVTTGR